MIMSEKRTVFRIRVLSKNYIGPPVYHTSVNHDGSFTRSGGSMRCDGNSVLKLMEPAFDASLRVWSIFETNSVHTD